MALIPQKIHFCWFGRNEKSAVINRCISSWKEHCPYYEIKEWNEENIDVNAHPFTKAMYEQKHWAFVADYVRLEILEKEGGIYLDTDMFLVQSLDPLIHTDCFLGEESPGVINAAALGAVPHHPFITKCKEYYATHTDSRITIPRILTTIFKEFPNKEGITIYPPEAFYPFDAEHISEYKGQALGDKTYGVHLWNYSWGHPLNRFFKKVGIYYYGKKIVEKLGVKEKLKKLLGFV